MKGTFIGAGLIVAFGLAVVLPGIETYRDMALIDRNTGSRKGYRDWPLGWRTGSWYQQSALEAFMRSNYPAEFRQDWVSYKGTGRNIFGGAMSLGHGRPGPIVALKPEAIDHYCRGASPTEKRRLYDVFASGDEVKIGELVEPIMEEGMGSEKIEHDRATKRSQLVPSRTNGR